MQAVGIIVEHNPFHNGHFYHVTQAKNTSKADVVVAVMSGHFLQRGEPALVDKWTRAKMALLGGVDLVIELPYVFATGNAPVFAAGSTYLLNALKCQTFAFGSEEGQIEPFLHTYHHLQKHTEEYNEAIKKAVAQGNSYPKALNIAFERIKTYANGEKLVDLSKPNNILGYHYVEAAAENNLAIKPLTIQRIQAGYHDDVDISQSIASATGIRKALFEEKDIDIIKQFVPETTYETLHDWQQQNGSFIGWENIWPLLKFAILRHSPSQLRRYADVAEGLEYSFIKHAKQATSYLEFMDKVKSKRYTWTRLQRMLLHIFSGIEKEQLHAFTMPSYIRILGMTENGQAYLSSVKKQLDLPLISRVGSNDNQMLQIDIHATNMYNIALEHVGIKKMNGDYFTPVIRI